VAFFISPRWHTIAGNYSLESYGVTRQENLA
jgi:hypothetical protein